MSHILNPGKTHSPQETEKIAKLLLAYRGAEWNKPLAADELLAMDREVFEPLFHKSPLGPIPEHLKSHLSVHGCVGEYEDQYEQLDRWKVQTLALWLRNTVGKKFTAGEDVYELSVERGEATAPDKYWLKPV